MSNLKRLPVKYIRDFAKSAYKKDSKCYICGATENLDLHHFSGVTQLFNKWCSENDITINDVDDILAVREDFVAQHEEELYKEVVTICRTHHNKLHNLYGKSPLLTTAKKQARWVEKQKAKHE